MDFTLTEEQQMVRTCAEVAVNVLEPKAAEYDKSTSSLGAREKTRRMACWGWFTGQYNGRAWTT